VLASPALIVDRHIHRLGIGSVIDTVIDTRLGQERSMQMQEPETLETVSLIRGGALYRFQETAHLIRPNQWNIGRRISIAVLVSWVPLVALSAMGDSRASLVALLKDYRVFARVFIAIPLLIAAQKQIEERFRLVVREFLDAGLLSPEDRPQFQAILVGIGRLKDAWIPELALVLLACIGGILFVGNDLVSDAPWSVRGLGTSLSHSPAGWYFELITQTIYTVLLGLALWKWCLYALFFWRVSRLQLQLMACDPDQSGGLGFVGYSPTAFIPVAIAASTAVGSVLRYDALHSTFSLELLIAILVVWVLLVFFVFFGPLAVFAPKLMQLRRTGYLQYSSLAHLLAEQFHAKWVNTRPTHLQELLAAPEIQVLSSLANTFDRLQGIKPLPVNRVTLIEVAVAAAVPMLPVVMTQIPLKELLRIIFRAMF
jgi:hypothetical protein